MSPSGLSSGAISSRAAGGFLFTDAVGLCRPACRGELEFFAVRIIVTTRLFRRRPYLLRNHCSFAIDSPMSTIIIDIWYLAAPCSPVSASTPTRAFGGFQGPAKGTLLMAI